MSQRRWGQLIICLGVVLIGAYALSGIGPTAYCFLPFSSGVMVDVTNDGSAPVSNLEISFTGGEKTLAKLDPGSNHQFRVKPTGDSGVFLSFVDVLGNSHREEVRVYLEKNYQGTIDVKIDQSGKIAWKDEITACPN